MKDQCRRRRCLCCKELFLSDPRSRYHQKFCSAGECQRVSKARSQKMWREKPQNEGYWRRPENSERVRVWRKANPGYSGGARKKKKVLPKRLASAKSHAKLNESPLQDDLLPQNPLIVGVISALAGSSLQEDIAVMCKHLIGKGREILEQENAAKTKQSAPAQPLRSLSENVRPSL